MRTTDMLESHPGGVAVDLAPLAATIEALEECANTCTQCADACLGERDLRALARCIRLNLDCADLCAATSRVISRQTEHDPAVTRPALEACIAICRRCGEECAAHAEHMEHCRVCSEACRGCEQACRDLLAAMS